MYKARELGLNILLFIRPTKLGRYKPGTLTYNLLGIRFLYNQLENRSNVRIIKEAFSKIKYKSVVPPKHDPEPQLVR